MSHRDLEIGETIKQGDELYLPKKEVWIFAGRSIGQKLLKGGHRMRRTDPEPATFDEASNFDVVARQKPVDTFIRVTDTKVSGQCHVDDVSLQPIAGKVGMLTGKVGEPGEWVNGLPKIGVTCNALVMVDGSVDWETGSVIGSHEGTLWMCFVFGYRTVNAKRNNFCPIKSKAELEADKRDIALADIIHSLPEAEIASIEWGAHAERIVEFLYDAGRIK